MSWLTLPVNKMVPGSTVWQQYASNRITWESRSAAAALKSTQD
jgi:hypothetical protein